MGIFKSIKNAFGGELNDMYIEFFTCGDFEQGTLLVTRGVRKNTTGNNKGNRNIISKGSQMVVPDETALILTDGGEVMECVETPGLFTWNGSSSATILSGDKVSDVAKDAGQRMKLAGETAKEQRVYYVKMQEIRNSAFLILCSKLPYKDPEYRNIFITLSIKFSFRVYDPIKFFREMCGNIWNSLHYARVITEQTNTEIEDIASEVINGYGLRNIPYSHLMSYKDEFDTEIRDKINSTWREARGIELVKFTTSVIVHDGSRKLIEKVDQSKIFAADPGSLGAQTVIGTTNAMNKAAANPNGAINGVVGVAEMSAAVNTASVFSTASQSDATSSASPVPGVHKCPFCCYEPEGGIFLTKNCDCCGSLLG